MDDIGKNFIVRKAEPKDSKRIWEIRNHPSVRENSNNAEEINFADHEAWLQKKYFNGESNHCYVLADKEKKAVGYCRLDYAGPEDSYIVSIAIDCDYHKKGLGGYLLGESLVRLNSRKPVLAEIKKRNIASFKLFERHGFKKYKADDLNYCLKFKKN